MANVIGPDVSFYQDDPQTPNGIDFRKMRQAGAEYVIIRSGQNLWADRDFKANWREAKAAGLPRGSYWFYDSRIDPKQQAELWVSLFNGDFGELPLWCDFEDNYNGGFRGWQHWYNFIERVKQLTPSSVALGVYTNYYYWLENTVSVNIPTASLNYFQQYPLWIATYNPTAPLIPKPWSTWTFWQYTDNGPGLDYGVESLNIDLNYFNGDINAFRARFKLTETPLPPPTLSNEYRVTVPSLRVREAPSLVAVQVGSILLNQVVEKVDENADGTWIKIKTKDGSLTGWCFAAYLQRLSASPTPTPDPDPNPDPTPEPEPTPTPTNKWYRVTASPSLRVRSGAGTSFPQVGSVLLNEVVEELEANADRSWLKIRKADNSVMGWVSSDFLAPTTAPENPEPPDDESKDWYRVTAAPSLKVRQGPGLEHDSIGVVYFGELVEKIDATLDGSWFKVRNKDGSVVGWSMSQYLISVNTPTPEPPQSGTTVPDHKDKNWYRVNTTVLNIREAPNLGGKIIGKLIKNDVVPGIDDESQNDWIQIQEVDGLTGWASKEFLVQIATTRPTTVTQNIFTGITYLRKDLSTPRSIAVHVIAIDLQTANIEFLVTPSPKGTDVLCTRPVSTFLEEFKLHLAINGGYFSYLDPTYDPAELCPSGGEPVRISDYAASRGKIYSKKKTWQPVVHISKKNQVNFTTFGKEPGFAVFNAIAGDRSVVTDGKVVKNLAALAPAPRTAVGLSKNGRWLTWMVVDGRQTGYSEGVTLSELGELLLSYGVHTGVNMDGGGSSSMVIRGFDGKPRILNSPIDMGKPGTERRVGNHLGLLVKG